MVLMDKVGLKIGLKRVTRLFKKFKKKEATKLTTKQKKTIVTA